MVVCVGKRHQCATLSCNESEGGNVDRLHDRRADGQASRHRVEHKEVARVYFKVERADGNIAQRRKGCGYRMISDGHLLHF